MTHTIGTKEKPMALKTPPLSSEYTMHVEQKDGLTNANLLEAWEAKRTKKFDSTAQP